MIGSLLKKRNRRKRPTGRVTGALQQQATRVKNGITSRMPALGKVGPLRKKRPTGRTVREAPEPTEPTARGLDLILLAAILSLLGLGLVLVYSSSAMFSQARHHTHTFFLQRHTIYMLAALFALFVGWRLDYGFYRRFAYPVLIGCLLLLVGLLIPGLGTKVDGATRWFRVGGISFQPSELAKFALVVYLASSLAKKRDDVRSFSIGFLPHLCVAGLICLLVVKQPDLGTTAVLGIVTLLMLFVAGTKVSYIAVAVLASAPVVYQLIVGTPWRMRRVLAFLDPWAYRRGAGYQVSESLISVGSGGMFGLGLGDGKQKLFFLPAAHTDFIFANIGEELGFVGLATVVVLFLIIVVRGLRASLGARDLFGAYLAFGITTLFGLQAALHMAVVLALVPTKGITLPLVSYGGSALVLASFCMGVLLNIAARFPEPPRLKLARKKPLAGNRKRQQRVVISEG